MASSSWRSTARSWPSIPGGSAPPTTFAVDTEATQLTRTIDGRSATVWIGDGGRYRLQVLDLRTGARRSYVTDVPVDAVECIDVLSPDGRWLASGIRTGETHAIVLTDLQAGSGRRITPPDVPGECPIWSPDSSRIAFVATTGVGRMVWVMQRDGSDPHIVSRDLHDAVASGANAWSPDGRWVYFDAVTPSNDGGSIYRTDVDAQRTERLTGDGPRAYAPQLSPDGSLLSYHVVHDPTYDLWAARADGAQAHLVLANATSMGWSSDGSALLASTGDPAAGPNGGLVAVRPDGTGLQVLLSFPTFCGARIPHVSTAWPGGSRVRDRPAPRRRRRRRRADRSRRSNQHWACSARTRGLAGALT